MDRLPATAQPAVRRVDAGPAVPQPQRLALAVNLLLVLVLGVLLVRVATYQRQPAGTTPTTASSAAPTRSWPASPRS